MNTNKFLTVMAVLDDKTQALLKDVQNCITQNVGKGTQTMEIPFHLTLGSYATDQVDDVVERIKAVATVTRAFPIKLLGYDSFGDSVFYLKPEIPDKLISLRKSFENDFAHSFEWVPHATLFCGGEEQVRAARAHAPRLTLPIDASIVGIELGEFFPAKKIIRINFDDLEEI